MGRFQKNTEEYQVLLKAAAPMGGRHELKSVSPAKLVVLTLNWEMLSWFRLYAAKSEAMRRIMRFIKTYTQIAIILLMMFSLTACDVLRDGFEKVESTAKAVADDPRWMIGTYENFIQYISGDESDIADGTAEYVCETLHEGDLSDVRDLFSHNIKETPKDSELKALTDMCTGTLRSMERMSLQYDYLLPGMSDPNNCYFFKFNAVYKIDTDTGSYYLYIDAERLNSYERYKQGVWTIGLEEAGNGYDENALTWAGNSSPLSDNYTYKNIDDGDKTVVSEVHPATPDKGYTSDSWVNRDDRDMEARNIISYLLQAAKDGNDNQVNALISEAKTDALEDGDVSEIMNILRRSEHCSGAVYDSNIEYKFIYYDDNGNVIATTDVMYGEDSKNAVKGYASVEHEISERNVYASYKIITESQEEYILHFVFRDIDISSPDHSGIIYAEIKK